MRLFKSSFSGCGSGSGRETAESTFSSSSGSRRTTGAIDILVLSVRVSRGALTGEGVALTTDEIICSAAVSSSEEVSDSSGLGTRAGRRIGLSRISSLDHSVGFGFRCAVGVLVGASTNFSIGSSIGTKVGFSIVIEALDGNSGCSTGMLIWFACVGMISVADPILAIWYRSSGEVNRAGGGAILVLSSETGRVKVLASCKGAGTEGADIWGCAIERAVLNGAGKEGLFVRIDGRSNGMSIVARTGYGWESVDLTGEKMSWL